MKIEWREIGDIKLECCIDLDDLLQSDSERNRFNSKWQDFHANNVNRDIYRREANRLIYYSEQLIPKKRSRRIPILLVLGNPASHSVKSGMFFAHEGKGQDHRFWKSILKPLADLELKDLGKQDADRINRTRRLRMLNLDYDSLYRIGLCVMVTMPSAPGGKWGGVQGIQRLLGRKAYEKVLEAESRRVTSIAKTFIENGGAVIAFQKDAWEALRCERSAAYSIKEAKAGNLRGRLIDAPEIPLYGVPPTRLSGPCRKMIKKVHEGQKRS
jgi:hypothetical protein